MNEKCTLPRGHWCCLHGDCKSDRCCVHGKREKVTITFLCVFCGAMLLDEADDMCERCEGVYRAKQKEEVRKPLEPSCSYCEENAHKHGMEYTYCKFVDARQKSVV